MENYKRINIKTGKRKILLRPYQLEMLEQATKKTPPFLMVLPTGGGKTLVAMLHVLLEGISKNKKIIWVAPSKELLNQGIDTLEKVLDIQQNEFGYIKYETLDNNEREFEIYCIDNNSSKDHYKYFRYYKQYNQYMEPFRKIKINRETINILRLYDGIDNAEDINKCDVVFTTYRSLTNNYAGIYNWMEEDVILIIDEAHHASAEELSIALKYLVDDKNKSLIGLTATPFRNDRLDLAHIFSTNDSEVLNKIEPVGMIDLINFGHLVKPTFTNDNTCRDLDDIVKYYQPDRHKKTVIFLRDINYIEELYEKFKKMKINVGTFYSYNRDVKVYPIKYFNAEKNKEFEEQFDQGVERAVSRDTIVEKFKESEFDVLINSKILCEGVDIPNLDTIFIVSRYNSPIQITQIAGRALRTAKGKEKCEIVNFTGKELDIYYKDGNNEGDINTALNHVRDQFIPGLSIDYDDVENDSKDIRGIKNSFIIPLYDLK